MIGSGGALQTAAYMDAGAPPRSKQGMLLLAPPCQGFQSGRGAG
ncbi:unnamed protein product [Urochloa humidicola]